VSDSLEASMMKRIGELKAEVQHLKFILEEERQIAREDGAGLRPENARLKSECQARQAENSVLAVECDSLKDEVERLTKAGDAMMGWIDYQHNGSGYKHSRAWEAAKKGGQS
jgi:hypothetical protein